MFLRVVHAAEQKLGVADDGVQRRADIVADIAEEHAPGLLRHTGAFERFLEFGHILGGLFVRDHEDMEETVADEAAERGERRKRPGDLENEGRRHRDAAHADHHGAPAYGGSSVEGFPEHENGGQEDQRHEQKERRVADEAHPVDVIGVDVEEAFVERIGRQCHEVGPQDRKPEPREDSRGLFAESKIEDDESAPDVDESDEGEKEEDRVDVQELRPAETGDDAP